jgi:aminopeptidase
MTDSRIQQLARVLVDHSARIREGDQVGIVASPDAQPLVEAVYELALERGGLPTAVLTLPAAEEILLKKGSNAQLEYLPQVNKLFIETFDAYVVIRSEPNTRALSSADPQRQARRRGAQAPMFKTYLERGASGALKWIGTQFPTQSYAQDAEMSLHEYEDFVYGACHVGGPDDPLAHWQKVQADQARLCEWLKPHEQVEVRGPNVDLRLSIQGRTFLNASGEHNMPDGEIYTGPVEDSVEGWIRYTYPAVAYGREVDGVEFYFEAGKVVSATARKNQDFLIKTLDTDPGARFLGEFAIGTNYGIQRHTKNILFDEKIGGTIHLAVGGGYPETGSRNESAVHWDMLCDMRDGGEIVVDGELFYRNGQFVV